MKRWSVQGEPSAAQIEAIAALIGGGGIVLMPTDTIYGLHALPSVAPRVAGLKRRDESKRFVTIAASAAQLASAGIDVPDPLRELWPAPLTAVLRHGGGTIAVRVPAVAWLRDLLERTGPLISTSANRSGEPSLTDPKALDPDLGVALDGIVDAGRREGTPSTIIDFTCNEPCFLREGDPEFVANVRKKLLRSD
ncbi:MAG TPA: L-threonylcarbamoyladenylate synthase [Thermoanaerobaculia bacterium]|nr:L-threonylcarbamoyladenylate synthase [Thermoanaerobaculia bacterium]